MQTLAQPDSTAHALHGVNRTLAQIIAVIQATLHIPAEKIDIDAEFDTLGIDSIISMELIANLSKALSITISPAQFVAVNTVRELADYLDDNFDLEENDLEESDLAESELKENALKQTHVATNQQTTQTPLSEQLSAFAQQQFGITLKSPALTSTDDLLEHLLDNNIEQLQQHYANADANTDTQQTISGPQTALGTQDIAIVGMSCRLPDADNPQQFWDNLIAEKNSVREIPAERWDWQSIYSATPAVGKSVSKWGGLLNDVTHFDAELFGITQDEAKLMDPQERLMLQQVYHAFEDAGTNIATLEGSNTGVFFGYQFAEYEHYLRQNQQHIAQPLFFTSSSPSYYLANRLSYLMDFRGPSESININCASSAIAINRAYYSLLNGESDLAVAGGVCLHLFADDYVTNSQYGLLSNDGTSGVFDKDANGFTRGEGVVALVLKRLSDAQADNDRIYALIKASQQNNRGRANSLSEIKHEAITDVLTSCYRKAGIAPTDVNYIEVDGYSTKWGDSFEVEGIQNVFADQTISGKTCALGSFKGNIGHPEPASGATAVMKLALSLYQQQFPATITKKTLSDFIDIDNPSHPLYIADHPIHFDSIRPDAHTPIRAGVNSFADSGANVHILLEEYRQQPRVSDSLHAANHRAQLLLFSAMDVARLTALVDAYLEYFAKQDRASWVPLAQLAYQLQMGRQALPLRMAIVAESIEQLIDKLTRAKNKGFKGKVLEKHGIYCTPFKRATHAKAEVNSSLQAVINDTMIAQQLQAGIDSSDWQQIALLWANGIHVAWSPVWKAAFKANDAAAKALMQPVSLPGYPFAPTPYWVDVDAQANTPASTVLSQKELGQKELGQTALGDVKNSVKSDVKSSAINSSNDDMPADHWYIYRSSTQADQQAIPEFIPESMPAAERISLFMRQLAAQSLGQAVDDVAIDIDLLALGLNSMSIADMMQKTNSLLGISLSPSVVFRYPRIDTLSDYLAQTYPQQADALIVTREAPAETSDAQQASQPKDAEADIPPFDILVPMQTQGENIPIFAIPGAGGIAVSLQQISLALGEQQPFYCLEAEGLDGYREPLTSVAEIAAANIAELRSVQAEGPYRLLGYSNGGVVAFEMAAQLIATGERIDALYLLDTLSPAERQAQTLDEVMQVFEHLLQARGIDNPLTIEALQAVTEAERGEFLYAQLHALGVEAPKAQFLGAYRVALASDRGVREYAQRLHAIQQPVPTIVFRAQHSYQDAADDLGWGALLATPPTQISVDASHFSLLIDPQAVNTLTDHIKSTTSTTSTS